MRPGVVKVDARSVRRAWRQSGDTEFWLELRTEQGSDAAFGTAVNQANEHEGDGGVFAQLNTRSPGGFVVQVSDVYDDTRLEKWAARFASTLPGLGFTGTLRGVTTTHWPEWVDAEGAAEPTAFISWSFDLDAMTTDPGRTSHWHVPLDATERISSHLATWTEPGGPQIILGRRAFHFAVADAATVPDIVRSATMASGRASIIRYSDAERRARTARTAPGGETVMQVVGGPEPWRERIDALRDAILALTDLTDQAFIRPSTRLATGWLALDWVQPLDAIEEIHVRYNKHLLARYVADAHGIQVLRDEHLPHTSDLTNWVVTALGNGRHLVEARDLAPWYGTRLPDAATVTQARDDFGEMILTKSTVEANPPPWAASGI